MSAEEDEDGEIDQLYDGATLHRENKIMAQMMNTSVSTERSIHEMLKDTPPMNETSGAVQSGTPVPPNTLALSTSSSGGPFSPGTPTTQNGDALLRAGASRIDSIKTWSISTYKCTKQLMFEKLGKSSRTVDTELEAQIEQLRDTQRKYSHVLRLSRAFASHFHHVVVTQHALGEAFSDLAQKSPELQEEFTFNSETQRNLTKNGEILLGALNFFTSTVNTLCNKTIEDTMLTIRQYETSRIEYDAYRSDLEMLVQSPRTEQSTMANEEAQRNYQKHKEQFEKLRSDVSVKLKFLDENRIKVMHKQLLLFHNAISAYFAGNAVALECTLKQFNVKVKSPNSTLPSWLEQHTLLSPPPLTQSLSQPQSQHETMTTSPQ